MNTSSSPAEQAAASLSHAADTRPGDAAPGNWVDTAPQWLEPYLRLARYDRPVGIWLLALPCWIGIVFARLGPDATAPLEVSDAILAALFWIGSVAMRGAGCTYNDILDHDIDAQVARTAGRPLPSGRVSLKAAWIWLLAQCLVGLCVLLILPRLAQYVALGALPMVALYPLMKRITWWPQAWLGLTFNWGVLVAAAALRPGLTPADFALYAGLAFWTIGYDTIYALQDKEDDAMIGVKSTARRFGAKVRTAVGLLYGICATLLAAACILTQETMGLAGVVLFTGHLVIQVLRTSPDMGDAALAIFKSNRNAGIILLATWGGVAAWGLTV